MFIGCHSAPLLLSRASMPHIARIVPVSLGPLLSTRRSPLPMPLPRSLRIKALVAIPTSTSSKRAERRSSLDIPTREPGEHPNSAFTNQPLLADDIPVRDISPHKVEGHSLALARLQSDLLETTKDLDGRLVRFVRRGLREAEVELGHRAASDGAGVGNRGGDLNNHDCQWVQLLSQMIWED